jgi:hypothetical protein
VEKGRMLKNKSFRHNYAVSEVIGASILIGIAVTSVIFISPFLSPDLDIVDKKFDVIGYVTPQGRAVLKHVGGTVISNYEVIVYNINGSQFSSKDYRDTWKIGECRYVLEDIGYPPLLSESDKVIIYILTNREDGSQHQIFYGELSGPPGPESSTNPVLISSLKQDSPDEDLICYSYPLEPNINATTYIYNWKCNGFPILDLNMPFDTEDNDTCRDYSGNGLNGNLTDGVIWTSNGVVGGAYYFGGSSEYLSVSLPNVFYDMSNNDFSVSIWLKSDDISVDDAVILMASLDNNNFVKIFSYGNEIHAATCIDGIQDAVRTENLTSNEWYHIVVVWDASEEDRIIYCNGELYTKIGDRTSLGSGKCLLEIGHGTSSSKFWKGYLDELEVYNRVLTYNQVYQLYLTTKDGNYDKRVMTSGETNIGEYWQCVVTPNDSVQDDIPVYSNIIQIKNYQGGN